MAMIVNSLMALQFISVSGGLVGGSDPPAFQRAEKERMEKEKAAREENEGGISSLNHDEQLNVSLVFLANKDTCMYTKLVQFFFGGILCLNIFSLAVQERTSLLQCEQKCKTMFR